MPLLAKFGWSGHHASGGRALFVAGFGRRRYRRWRDRLDTRWQGDLGVAEYHNRVSEASMRTSPLAWRWRMQAIEVVQATGTAFIAQKPSFPLALKASGFVPVSRYKPSG